MICKKCEIEYEKWQPEIDKEAHPFAPDDNGLCIGCNEKAWSEFEAEHADEIGRIKKYESEGHHPHCACRLVWGDGECECEDIKNGYDPYAWMRRKQQSGRE